MLTQLEPQNWRDTWRILGNVPMVFRFAWKAHRWATIGMGLVTVLAALLPLLQAYIVKIIIDTIILSINTNQVLTSSIALLTPYLLLELLIVVTNLISNQLRIYMQTALQPRLNYEIDKALMLKCLSLDVKHFETPSFYDKLQNAQSETSFKPIIIVNSTYQLIQTIITISLSIVVLLSLNFVIAVLLLLSTFPIFFVEQHFGRMQFNLLNWRAPEARRQQYYAGLLTTDKTVREVKLFGLGDHILKQYNYYFDRFYHQDMELSRKHNTTVFLCNVVSATSYYGSYLWIILQTLLRRNTIGDMTFYLSLFGQGQASFQQFFASLASLTESSLFMDNLTGFLSLSSDMTSSEEPKKLPLTFKIGIEFRNVSFRYASDAPWVLRNINLQIAPGERVAIVGRNGVGKTTLVKLLCRFYDPTEGQILIDGIDIKDYQATELRRRIGVIFQDFVCYYLTARENIAIGNIQEIDNHEKVCFAAKQSGANEIISKLPEQYETMLGHWFEEGHQLSGGEWQKIALARAFMRDADMLILDEPTASMDAEFEYKIFQQFQSLTQGKIALLISHRFSTVRMANRIIVIDEGRLVEVGTHEQLIQLEGLYAEMFNKQAIGYRV
ncbi:ABC transporter ATP-binding protein [Candidatus Gracilibacteria bacterium]|nr:ABC transporter ATP-binding protein [Candidatus Gracilibacteria bacterium]